MSEELGKINRPPADSFKGARKMIVIPLIFSGKDAPQDFSEIYQRFWSQVTEHIRKLEAKLGKLSRIYHEMVFKGGEEGIKVLEELNPESHSFVKEVCEGGVVLEGTEDAELAMENMDWERCLMVAMGQKARNKIMEFHRESAAARYNYISRQIDNTLNEDEIGLLFVREGHPTQFPKDIEVFTVSPPALDELNRWLRDYSQRIASSDFGQTDEKS